MSRTFIRRTALLSVLLPCLYFGTASATFLYRIHAENSARTNIRLARQGAPVASQRLVIFAPHPDDETLGCAGLIQQATAAGAHVRVILLTNGDGFRVAVERQFRQLHVEPDDYVRFAALRQEETYRALGLLGLERDGVLFLGYPDRGLLPLWTTYWDASHPYRSPYTRYDLSPYDVAYRKEAVYCGQDLLNDIKRILRASEPTDVYVTHPSDDHPDHTAASSFVALALQELRSEPARWAHDCRLHYYLIHRGDWPAPEGLYKSDVLVPPREMAALDTHWSSLSLTAPQVDRKCESILAYASQTAMMKRFLVSFARKNELFGTLDPVSVPRVADGRIVPDGRTMEWQGIPPAVLDPVNDSLLRDFQGGGDIAAVYVCRDTTQLNLRIDTYQPVSESIEFRLGIRYFGDPRHQEPGGTYTATIHPSGAASPPDVRTGMQANRLEVTIPLRRLGYTHLLAVDVNTLFAGILVDRTGYRFLRL